ncbi:MAG TPA: RHS repeat-associated core domain-containing protein [Pirellulales bacterium]|nr:RHS repeat-associated core domain-containing protein [Pirellulales bacterium]
MPRVAWEVEFTTGLPVFGTEADFNSTEIAWRKPRNLNLVYNSFGQVAYESAPTVHHLEGYTGAISDADTGMVSDWHRWYDPAVGRWISEDPMEFSAGDANLSRYVGNGATNYVDPFGLFPPNNRSEDVRQLINELNQLHLAITLYSNIHCDEATSILNRKKRISSDVQQLKTMRWDVHVTSEFTNREGDLNFNYSYKITPGKSGDESGVTIENRIIDNLNKIKDSVRLMNITCDQLKTLRQKRDALLKRLNSL